MKKLKIIAVIENLDDSYGGPSVSLPGLLQALRNKHSIDVELVSIRWRDDERNETIEESNLKWDNAATCLGPKKIMFSYQLLKKILNKSDTSTIVYINNLWNFVSFSSFLAAKFKGAKVVYAPRGSLFDWSLSQRYFVKKVAWLLFQKSFINRSDLVHVTSDAEALAISKLGIATNKIVNVPHGVKIKDCSGLISENINEIEIFQSLPERRYFLFMSRLHAKKGLDLLLDIWDRVRANFPDWELVIAGPDYGGYTSRIKKSNICYLGEVYGHNKDILLKNAEFFVLPSYTENFGVVIAEALAAGKPVLTSDQTPWSIINEMGCGICAPLDQFEDSLRIFLLHDCKVLSSMGLKGRELIESQYSWDKRAGQFYNLVCEPLMNQ